MPADGAGIRFGQYVLLRRLARGGMAEVFLAQQHGFEGFDRRVAVKRILPHLADAPDFIQMFLSEAKLAAQLSHPNIVHIYDFGKVDADYFIAMEYVEGVHAGQLVKHAGESDRPGPTMIARIGAEVAAALHYAHELRAPGGRPYGLVHRDVSPANVMVSFDGVVKLCDFGIAKAAAIGDQLTRPGQVKGKYAYMSPEQIAGDSLDGRSDVFSLGIVLWELSTGRSIVPRGDAVAAMLAIRDGKLTPIERAAPWTPAPLARAITRALRTDREHRPTAMELAEELETFIKSSPELATAMQLGGWLRSRFSREQTGRAEAGPHGAVAAPGTRAEPRTASPQAGPPAPAVGAGPSRTSVPSVDTLDTTSERVALAARSPGAAASSALAGQSAAGGRAALAATAIAPGPAAHAATVIAPGPAAHAATVIAPGRAAQAPTVIAPGRAAGAATVMAGDRAASAPGTHVIRNAAAFAVPAASPLRASPQAGLPAMSGTALARLQQRRVQLMLGLGGAVVIGVAVFVIAIAARGKSRAMVAEHDAAVADVPGDAQPIDAPPVDAPSIDARTPTILPDTDARTVLEVRTRPRGAVVKIGAEAHTAPTQFTLPAGRYFVDAELDGWMPERRAVDLVKGERVVQEIVFTTRLSHRAQVGRTGKLTVRTTPASEVFLGPRRLAGTPITGLELAPGSYTLVFKHPRHATISRRVTITAGKTTKLSFALP